MKILYLQLKNYAMIYTGMNLKKIEIDLSKAENKIIMLIGPNGSGKTSILSCLHPYAYNTGVDDGKADSNLIMEDKDGYKEIHYDINGIFYKIKHFFYNKHGRRSVKSFIEREGIELNPNGNVTSFMDISREIFGIDPSYLTLLRLGSNVKNFIDKKHSERKDFSANLMSEIDDYLKFHKNSSDDIRSMKNTLSNCTTKLDRLGISDRDLFSQDIDNDNKLLVTLTNDLETSLAKIGNLGGQISTLIPDELEFRSSYRDNIRELDRLKSKIEKDTDIIKESSDITNIEFELSRLEKDNNSKENELASNKSMRDFMIKNLSSLYDQKEERESSMKVISSIEDYEAMKNKVQGLVEWLNEYEETNKDYSPTYTEDDISTLIAYCQSLNETKTEIYSHSSIAMRAVIEKRGTGNSIYSYINSNLNSTIENITKNEFRLTNLLNGSKPDSSDYMYIIVHPEGCTVEECPYLEFYEDHNCKNVDTEVDKIRKKLATLKSNRGYYRDMEVIDALVSDLFSKLNIIGPLIKRCKMENELNRETIIQSVRLNTYMYDEAKLTSMLDKRISFSIYEKNSRDIIIFKKELQMMENNVDSIKRIYEDLDRINTQIFEIENELARLKETDDNILLEIIEINNTMDKLRALTTIENELKDNIEKSIVLEEEISKSTNLDIKVKQLKTELSEIQSEKSRKEFSINQLRQSLDSKRFRLMNFDNIKKEYNDISKIYDEFITIREAVSGSKGIPLLYQEVFQKNTRSMMNQFLDIKYKGDLIVDTFVINEKEYRIPYIKKGVTVSDVVYASQGEKSFITLALSFALMIQSMDRYNIMLLDEIDATLDTSSRRVFLDILEKQMSNMNSEQVFVISHNQMFDNYATSVIYTGDGDAGVTNQIIWQKG